MLNVEESLCYIYLSLDTGIRGVRPNSRFRKIRTSADTGGLSFPSYPFVEICQRRKVSQFACCSG